jgi:hypothetical protein
MSSSQASLLAFIQPMNARRYLIDRIIDHHLQIRITHLGTSLHQRTPAAIRLALVARMYTLTHTLCSMAVWFQVSTRYPGDIPPVRVLHLLRYLTTRDALLFMVPRRDPNPTALAAKIGMAIHLRWKPNRLCHVFSLLLSLLHRCCPRPLRREQYSMPKRSLEPCANCNST